MSRLNVIQRGAIVMFVFALGMGVLSAAAHGDPILSGVFTGTLAYLTVSVGFAMVTWMIDGDLRLVRAAFEWD